MITINSEARADVLCGIQLRYELCVCLLDARTPLTIRELVERIEARGFTVPGRASKVVSDALRWEVRRGRVIRVGRGRYARGAMPRSTEWWIRKHADARRRAVVAPTLAQPGGRPHAA
jgi:hypothetical protein